MVQLFSMKKVMIAAGGTGGHIYPALALAETITELKPTSEVCFFGSSNRMEAEIIPNKGYQFYGIDMSGMNGGIVDKFKSLTSLLKGIQYCRKVLKVEKPDVCVGFGNYISVPLIIAAHQLKIPTMIHEQNSFVGKANKLLAKYADAIVGCYETNLIDFPKEKTRLLGNPEASIVAKLPMDKSIIKEYGLDIEKPFVVFVMGSLGSSSVAKVIDESCSKFDESYQVLIVSGKANDYEFQTKKENVFIVPYIDGPKVLRVADLAVTRAGATTLAEITALGVPVVLIPSPYVPNNHQVQNAMELVNKEAAIMIEEKDLSVDSLSTVVNELMKNEEERNRMKENALQLGKVNAANDMVKWLEDLTQR